MTTRRRPTFRPLVSLVPVALAGAIVAPAALPPLTATAFARQAAEAPDRTFMRLTEPAMVRSGPDRSYYHFLELAAGDVVEVLQERGSYAVIRTEGPRFAAGFALLRVRDGETGHFEVVGPERTEPTGRRVRTGVVRDDLMLFYPNVSDENLGRSWRTIRRLGPGTEVPVIGGPIDAEGVTFHRVALPDDARAFVPTAALEPASAEEAADYLAWEADPAAWLAARRTEAEAREQARLAAERAAQAEAEAAAAAAAAAAAEAERLAGADDDPSNAATGDADEPATPVAVPERRLDLGDAATNAGAGRDAAVEESDAGTIEMGRDRGPAGDDPATADRGDASGDTEADPADAAADAAEGEGEGEGADAGASDASQTGEPSGSEAVAELPPAERLEALEQAFDLLQREDARRAEVLPLARLYRAFATDRSTEDADLAAFATTRARQLELWARLQAQQERIEALRREVSDTDAALANAARTIQVELGFNAVGRLAGSRIFDGRRLPQLLRLEALESSRTLAYVRGPESLALGSHVGEIVGLVGERTYDPGLQLDVIDVTAVRPVRIDVAEPGDAAGDADAG